ncbi:MAG: hypothetical protein KDA92_11075 [Planctomycetales bacterium]|nr:hypothetical protein [Planctomycetales bacterium]
MRLNRLSCLAVALTCLLPTLPAWAAHCVSCGAPAGDDWVCRPVKTMRTVESTVWDTVCEPICVPACSLPSGSSTHGANCDDAGSCDGLACDDPGCSDCSKGNSLTSWLTGARRVRMRHRLVRKTVVQCVPTVEYVVEPRCSACCGATGGGCASGGCDAAGFATYMPGAGPVTMTLTDMSLNETSALGYNSAVERLKMIRSGAGVYMTLDTDVSSSAATTPAKSGRGPVQMNLTDQPPTVWLDGSQQHEVQQLLLPPTQTPELPMQGIYPIGPTADTNTTDAAIRTVSYEFEDFGDFTTREPR